MRDKITLRFKPLVGAMIEAGLLSRPVQAELQAWVLYSAWVCR